MTTVCFTGRGTLGESFVQRHDWNEAAESAGYTVGDKIFDVLVASRDDTSKADNARRRGASVMTYAEFAGELLMQGVRHVGSVDLAGYDGTSLKADRERAAAAVEEAKRKHAEAKREAEERTQDAMRGNELWGIWG